MKICRLSFIRRFLTNTVTATHASAFILFRIDFCNSELFGSTHDETTHWERLQSCEDRIILDIKKSDNIDTFKISSLAS